eukprot:scaffold3851_cov387-Prasinococcus_capsulatus_cf.AAC.8
MAHTASCLTPGGPRACLTAGAVMRRQSARAAFMRALSTMAVPKLVDVARAWQKVSEADAQVMYMSV